MICQICITSNKADHLITYKGDSLVVCDACFENRPDDAIEANPQPSECHDCGKPTKRLWQASDSEWRCTHCAWLHARQPTEITKG